MVNTKNAGMAPGATACIGRKMDDYAKAVTLGRTTYLSYSTALKWIRTAHLIKESHPNVDEEKLLQLCIDAGIDPRTFANALEVPEFRMSSETDIRGNC